MKHTTCRDATELISRDQDGLVNLSDRARLNAHLQVCSHCRRYQAQVLFISNLARNPVAEQVLAGQSLSDSGRARLRAAVQAYRRS